jgi:hypothetical protein
MNKDVPEWFDSALENTRRNYTRIDVSNQQCPYCGCAIHVATGWIGEPKQKGTMSLSEQHRQNMLQGYPTWKLTKYIIDPNQPDDP